MPVPDEGTWTFAGKADNILYYVRWDTLRIKAIDGKLLTVALVRGDSVTTTVYMFLMVDCGDRTFVVLDPTGKVLSLSAPLPHVNSIADIVATRGCGTPI